MFFLLLYKKIYIFFLNNLFDQNVEIKKKEFMVKMLITVNIILHLKPYIMAVCVIVLRKSINRIFNVNEHGGAIFV